MFFLFVFGAAMIGGVGLQPVGPQFQGVYWLPFFSAGLLSALLIMLLQPRNLTFGRQSISDKFEQGALAKQIQGVTTRVLRLLFGVVATVWAIGMLVRFVLS